MLSLRCSAQTCCSGGVPLANNIGGLPVSTKNTWQFSFSADLNVLQTLKQGADKLNDDSRQRKTLSLLLKTSYSFTDKFFIEGLLSWVRQERTIDQAAGFSDSDQTQGAGDVVILANYNYLSIGRTKLIGGIGPKIPAGRSDLKDSDGLTLNADLQPGSGAWDAVFFHRLQATGRNRPSRLYFSNFTYRYTGVNKDYLGGQHYRFGNELQILSGIADQFVIGQSLISFGLNARYRSANQDKFNNEALPSTGGRWIFIMPVVGWHIKSNLIVSINGELPLYANAEGTQLSPTFRINGGIYYSFSKKNFSSETFK
jgi:hypothetical protein